MRSSHGGHYTHHVQILHGQFFQSRYIEVSVGGCHNDKEPCELEPSFFSSGEEDTWNDWFDPNALAENASGWGYSAGFSDIDSRDGGGSRII